MLFVSLIRWWYGFGWLDQVSLVRGRISKTADLFSIELSARSFFKPFRQIDADVVNKGPLGVILRAMFDQLFSRFFGAVIRSMIIIAGSVAVCIEALVGGIRLVTWPLLPVLPLLSLPLVQSSWMPWQ
jgi:hypothetical protein